MVSASRPCSPTNSWAISTSGARVSPRGAIAASLDRLVDPWPARALVSIGEQCLPRPTGDAAGDRAWFRSGPCLWRPLDGRAGRVDRERGPAGDAHGLAPVDSGAAMDHHRLLDHLR